MIHYNNPNPESQSLATGLDKAIFKIQQKFVTAQGFFVRKVFGRAFLQKKLLNTPQQGETLQNQQNKRLRPLEITYPEGYTAEGEEIDLMPNDNLASYCFFIVNDPVKYIDFDPQDNQQLCEAPVSIIFWGNVFKLTGATDRRVTETYKLQAINLLKTVGDFQLTGSYEGFNKVFEPFTITETYRHYSRKPYFAFRFDGILTYPMVPENEC